MLYLGAASWNTYFLLSSDFFEEGHGTPVRDITQHGVYYTKHIFALEDLGSVPASHPLSGEELSGPTVFPN